MYESINVLSKNEKYNLGDLKLKNTLVESIIVMKKESYGLIEQDNLNDFEIFFFSKKHNTITKWLHYFEAYDRFFAKYRNRDVTILEIGVFKGGSLQMWKDYFQTLNNKVTVYGIDIFIEYSKNLIDILHTQYMETEVIKQNEYSGRIKAISYYDSMIFIEKMKLATKSLSVDVEIQ